MYAEMVTQMELGISSYLDGAFQEVTLDVITE
jgi:hypothetical protein